MPKAKKVFSAKKEISKSDAKKLRPLKKFWSKKLKEARESDNWFILFIGAFLGFVLGLIV